MLPKYSKFEIRERVKNELSKTEEEFDQEIVEQILNQDGIWLAEHYKTAAKILDISIEELVSTIPSEDLDSISFRAEENNEEINRTVKEINEIFELLTYQLKIGNV